LIFNFKINPSSTERWMRANGLLIERGNGDLTIKNPEYYAITIRKRGGTRKEKGDASDAIEITEEVRPAQTWTEQVEKIISSFREEVNNHATGPKIQEMAATLSEKIKKVEKLQTAFQLLAELELDRKND